MRDLAHQNLRSRKRKITQRNIRIFISVVIITAFIFLFTTYLNFPGVGSSVTLKDAPKGLTPVEVTDASVSVEGGVNLTSNKATLRNVGQKKASATAERVFGGGTYTLSVVATFAGTKGHRYQVWLTDGGESLVDAGFMEGSGDSWALTFRDSDRGLSKLRFVWITDEITTEDNRPETHVLEGSF